MSIALVLKLLELLIPLVVVIGVSVIAFGLLEYLTTSGDEMSKKEGKNKMFFGSVALVVTAVLWILAKVLKDTM